MLDFLLSVAILVVVSVAVGVWRARWWAAQNWEPKPDLSVTAANVRLKDE